MTITNEKTVEERARRAAARAGFAVRKSRGPLSMNNHGGFQIIDDRNCVVAGSDFDLTPEDVVAFCT